MLLFHLFQYPFDILNEVLRWYCTNRVVSWLVLSNYAGSNFSNQSWNWSFQAKEGAKCAEHSR